MEEHNKELWERLCRKNCKRSTAEMVELDKQLNYIYILQEVNYCKCCGHKEIKPLSRPIQCPEGEIPESDNVQAVKIELKYWGSYMGGFDIQWAFCVELNILFFYITEEPGVTE